MITACKTRSGTPEDSSREIIPLVIPYSYLFTQKPAHEDCFGGLKSTMTAGIPPPNTCVSAETTVVFCFFVFFQNTLFGFNVQSLSFSQQRQLGFSRKTTNKQKSGVSIHKDSWVSIHKDSLGFTQQNMDFNPQRQLGSTTQNLGFNSQRQLGFNPAKHGFQSTKTVTFQPTKIEIHPQKQQQQQKQKQTNKQTNCWRDIRQNFDCSSFRVY